MDEIHQGQVVAISEAGGSYVRTYRCEAVETTYDDDGRETGHKVTLVPDVPGAVKAPLYLNA